MCKNMNLDIDIQGCPIVREDSGLALSSRNSYLTEEQRKNAASIFKVLSNIEYMFNEGITDKEKVFSESLKLLHESIEVEYLEICDLNTLDYCEKIVHNSIIAIAVRIASVRLIDNMVI